MGPVLKGLWFDKNTSKKTNFQTDLRRVINTAFQASIDVKYSQTNHYLKIGNQLFRLYIYFVFF